MEKTKTLTIFVSVLVFIFLTGSLLEANASVDPNDPLPSFGSGTIEVRLYSDYFCKPCRETEPVIEPILKDLIKRKVIRLKMIDVPFNKNTPLYARYYLYGIRGKKNLAQALRIKNILYEAAAGPERIGTPDQLEKFLNDKGVTYSPYNVDPVLKRYTSLINEDKIDHTPTVVIYRNGKKEKYIGRDDVIKALKTQQTK